MREKMFATRARLIDFSAKRHAVAFGEFGFKGNLADVIGERNFLAFNFGQQAGFAVTAVLVLAIFEAQPTLLGDPPSAVDELAGIIFLVNVAIIFVIDFAKPTKINCVLKIGILIDINKCVVTQLFVEPAGICFGRIGREQEQCGDC